MKRTGSWIVVVLAIGGLVVTGCSEPAAAVREAAIKVEKQPSGLSRLTLSPRAAERLSIQMATVSEQGARKVVPYAAVIYDADGGTWAYTTSAPLTYERASIAIESIRGSEAFLSSGPAAGTAVVVVGAAELYGAETGVGGGQ